MYPYKEIERLNKIIIGLNKTILEQAKVIEDLKAYCDRYENPKDSRNSSIPPGHDYSRPPRTKSLREPSNKKPGGQLGHEGITLGMAGNPDETIFHTPQFCNCCGRDLSQFQAELVECRQEVALPVIQPVYIEHQNFQKTCPCGNKVVSGFPAGITPASVMAGMLEALRHI